MPQQYRISFSFQGRVHTGFQQNEGLLHHWLWSSFGGPVSLVPQRMTLWNSKSHPLVAHGREPSAFAAGDFCVRRGPRKRNSFAGHLRSNAPASPGKTAWSSGRPATAAPEPKWRRFDPSVSSRVPVHRHWKGPHAARHFRSRA